MKNFKLDFGSIKALARPSEASAPEPGMVQMDGDGVLRLNREKFFRSDRFKSHVETMRKINELRKKQAPHQ